MSKHTPGPWRSLDEGYPFDDHYRVAGPDNALPSGATWQADNRPIVAMCANPADAHLIAAAPDMLGALKIAHNVICQLVDEKNLSAEGMTAEEYQKHSTWVGRIQSAIAKAEGRS